MKKAIVCGAIIVFFLWSRVAFSKGECAIASYYGDGEKLNKYTASGEIFDPSKMTGAMWGIPFGTKMLVTNLNTGKSVIVRINDRGPAKYLNRDIDLSRDAFQKIADLKEGLIQVSVKFLE